MPALIFDCDGVLADTERDGHLPAFNEAFLEFGLPVRWSEREYGAKLAIGGGRERVASALTPDVVGAGRIPVDPEGRRLWLERFHARKTEIFAAIVQSGRLPARPGVVRLVDEALGAGWLLAVASTSAESSVRAVLDHVLGGDRATRFAVFAGDAVDAKKPDPAIYELAVARMGVAPAETLAIEDSRNGLLAATRAGLRCIVTVSSYSSGEDFSEAALVVSSLGDLTAPAEILANRSSASPEALVALRDLEAVLRSPA
ncbi:MAG TPA: HAD-IA family hydrolase [Gaiellaceae bacterium]|jgi:HAD superfamily hydrolase (TIGR01509 family)|nr:HAD-IA family hydrolase [Gaiellaceae bacterium]